MSSDTTTGFGAKIGDNSQFTKTFYSSQSPVTWTYVKKGMFTSLTPANKKMSVIIDNDLTVNKDLTVNGNIYNPSDVRLKDNISNIEPDESNDLFTLNPIHFSYKNDKNKKIHYGVLAQDVEKVFPNLVEEKITVGYKAVNYIELIPIIIAKMKTMQQQIDTLLNDK
jgi:hypothetical protein